MGRMMDELGRILEGSGSGINVLSPKLCLVEGEGVMTRTTKYLGHGFQSNASQIRMQSVTTVPTRSVSTNLTVTWPVIIIQELCATFLLKELIRSILFIGELSINSQVLISFNQLVFLPVKCKLNILGQYQERNYKKNKRD
jgi:hypothetical protein